MVGASVQTGATAGTNRSSRRKRRGQAMIEYIVVFVALFATVISLAVLLYAVRQQSNRTLDLVASDYP